MTQKNLNPTDSHSNLSGVDDFDSFLKSQLRHSTEYIDDQGFSASLIAKLPKVRMLPKWLEWTILVVPSLLVALLVLNQLEFNDALIACVAILKSLSFTQLLLLAAGMSSIFVMSIIWWIGQEKN